MDKSQSVEQKAAENTRVHTVWFNLYDVYFQAKLNLCDVIKMITLGNRELTDYNGAWRSLLAPIGGDGGVYMSVHIHRIHQPVPLRIMFFTVYIIAQYFLKIPVHIN